MKNKKTNNNLDYNIIDVLQSLNQLRITCPDCNESFSIKKAQLFDVRKPYSNKIRNVIKAQKLKLDKELKNIEKQKLSYLDKIEKLKLKEKQLNHRINNRPQKVEIATKSTNIGQLIEKILPVSKQYKFDARECVSVFKPIDYISFNGLNNNNVSSISFIEVKTGNGRLNTNQNKIKNIINSGEVSLKLF